MSKYELIWYYMIDWYWNANLCCNPSSLWEAGYRATWSTELPGLNCHDWMMVGIPPIKNGTWGWFYGIVWKKHYKVSTVWRLWPYQLYPSSLPSHSKSTKTWRTTSLRWPRSVGTKLELWAWHFALNVRHSALSSSNERNHWCLQTTSRCDLMGYANII